MKILVAIPCFYGAGHTREAINSIIGRENVDILLIDNGAEQEVKALIDQFYKNERSVDVIRNPQNIFVNAAWNQAMDYFRERTDIYDYLCIMNSDLILQKDWSEVLIKRWTSFPTQILLPIMKEDKVLPGVNTDISEAKLVTEGTPGVFITLSRFQVHMIVPNIPSEIKVWFGDNWIYEILRAAGYKTIIPDNFVAYHYWSQTVSKVPGISEIIEQDKVSWENIVKPQMINYIEGLKK